MILPTQPAFGRFVGGLFSVDAALKRPACIVQPESTAEVSTTLRIVSESGCAATVRGGGLSALCAGDSAVMIDLKSRMNRGTLVGSDARVDGGATMGTVLATLAPRSRIIPIGVLPVPGMGLALRGGIGYLTRGHGLTLDHVREVELVVASGEVLTLSADSVGGEADLWWAVRGCGTHLGVATSVTFASIEPPSTLYSQRSIVPLEALAAYFETAPALPRELSMSALLAPPQATASEPLLMLYAVYAGDDRSGIELTEDSMRSLLDRAGVRALYEFRDQPVYTKMPAFDLPAADGTLPAPPQAGAPLDRRMFLVEKCPYLKALDAEVADKLVRLIRSAPTPLCRMDFQHCGGAVGDVAPTDTAFWNRDFEWSVPLIGAWIGPDGPRAQCADWIDRIMQTLEPYVVGMYSTEIQPGRPETAREVELAFGGNLPKLKALRAKWDPDPVFRLYYPL